MQSTSLLSKLIPGRIRGWGVLKSGPARRVVFFYPGEEGTYLDHAYVTLYRNGIIHIESNQEETMTHLQNCEILWNFNVDPEDVRGKLKLLKPAE